MKLICLGIESTAHTFGIGIIDSDGKILADERDMFTTEKGGLIPNEVAKHHREVCDEVLEKALENSKLTLKDINLISFSRGPGLAPSLKEGMEFSKRLSKENKIPLIGVNHIAGHLEIGKLLTEAKDPIFLFTSGANTQVIALEDKYRIFGEALSVAIGNALDKFGREAGLGFPCGPKIEELAKKGKYVKLPYVVKGMDVEFSGIVTKAISLIDKEKLEDLCFSLQETCFAMLAEVSERAMAHCEKEELLLIGGVAANKRLVEMLEIMCKERNAKFYYVPIVLLF